ncbi:hypothetical protein F4779DRAFT_642497 [Xylariaceae sp. FL0662B]|nr:hypothetical protein F4779DRAFT_642497 [Xylariaceae sp. FL0662B]
MPTLRNQLLVGSSSPGLNDIRFSIPEANTISADHLAISNSPSTNLADGSSTYGLADDAHIGNANLVQTDHSSSLGHDPSIFPRPLMGAHRSFASKRAELIPAQHVELQNWRPINWLPFDQSISEDLSLPGMESSMTAPITGLDSTALQAGLENYPNEPNDNHGLLGTSESSSLHSMMSALVRSMTVSLPGLSNVANKSALPSDETNEKRPVTLYADGAGARTSQADRTILERHEIQRIQGDSVLQGSAPSWMCALEAKLRRSQNLIRENTSVPDGVLEESLTQMSPKLQNNPTVGQFMSQGGLIFRKDTLKLFINMYFRTFHRMYPFLDQSLLCIPVWGWTLCVATAAIGARYLYIPEVTTFSDCLCSILYDVLTQEFNFGLTEDSLPYIQARTLVAIGLCHSHEYPTMNSGYNAASLLYNSCLRFHLLDEDDHIGAFQQDQDLEQVWIAWRFRESRRRTGLFIWLLDCVLAVATQTPPRFQTKLFNLRLPSTNELWEAETYQEWSDVQAKQSRLLMDPKDLAGEDSSRLTVREAARSLSTNLLLPGPVTSLGVSVLIHILIRRIWDASWYEDDSGRQSFPSGQSTPGDPQSAAHDSSPRYLATVPEYAQWRNRTCDSLDVLHWDALSTSARAGGREDPVFLQLHLARLVILTPVRELFGYLSTYKGLTGPSSCPLLPSDLYDIPPCGQHCRQTISTWANRDRYKARLAVIHAGAIYWHVRRFSSDSFLQPLAVYLAAVTLWAFGRFSRLSWSLSQPPQAMEGEISKEVPNLSHATLTGRSGMPSDNALKGFTDIQSEKRPSSLTSSADRGNITSSSTPAQQSPISINYPSSATTARRFQYRQRMPSHIQLDRPVDDELVQHFIRSGETMTLILEGVSDLCSDSGAEQVLREGVIVLDPLGDVWTVAETYKESLETVLRR